MIDDCPAPPSSPDDTSDVTIGDTSDSDPAIVDDGMVSAGDGPAVLRQRAAHGLLCVHFDPGGATAREARVRRIMAAVDAPPLHRPHGVVRRLATVAMPAAAAVIVAAVALSGPPEDFRAVLGSAVDELRAGAHRYRLFVERVGGGSAAAGPCGVHEVWFRTNDSRAVEFYARLDGPHTGFAEVGSNGRTVWWRDRQGGGGRQKLVIERASELAARFSGGGLSDPDTFDLIHFSSLLPRELGVAEITGTSRGADGDRVVEAHFLGATAVDRLGSVADVELHLNLDDITIDRVEYTVREPDTDGDFRFSFVRGQLAAGPQPIWDPPF